MLENLHRHVLQYVIDIRASHTHTGRNPPQAVVLLEKRPEQA